MQVPWAQTAAEVRRLFQTVTDVVVIDVYDMPVFDEEGEEQDPIDGCRVFVRTQRIAQKIREVTGWHQDKTPNFDLGYTPTATFTLACEPDIVQYQLETFLSGEGIYREGRWINTYQP